MEHTEILIKLVERIEDRLKLISSCAATEEIGKRMFSARENELEQLYDYAKELFATRK